MVNGISSGFLLAYMNFKSKPKMSLEEMFKKLSIEMGGDGETISKDQLNNHINKLESNPKANKTKLMALKEIQKNWDTIAGKKDSIAFGDLEKYKALLALASMPDEEPITSTGKPAEDSKTAIDYLNEILKSDKEKISKGELKSELKSLIAENSDEVDNNDKIALITNFLAEFDALSGGEEHISAKTLHKSTDLEA